MTESAPEVLRRAAEALGSASAVARVVGVTPQAASDLLRRGRPAPAEWCIPLERATTAAGKPVSRHQLRPDLYPIEGEAA